MENSNCYAWVNTKPVLRILVFIIILFGKRNTAVAVTLGNDSIPEQVNLFELQGKVSKINNATGMASIRNKVRKNDTSFIMIKVLHIGDSHIKAGFFQKHLLIK